MAPLGKIVALVLSLAIPHEPLPRCYDVVEVNHVYSEEGNPVFSQVILWDWDRDRHVVGDWKMLDRVKLIRRARGATVRWEGLRIDGCQYRETWTQYDVEQEDRAKWPLDNRRKVKVSKQW